MKEKCRRLWRWSTTEPWLLCLIVLAGHPNLTGVVLLAVIAAVHVGLSRSERVTRGIHRAAGVFYDWRKSRWPRWHERTYRRYEAGYEAARDAEGAVWREVRWDNANVLAVEKRGELVSVDFVAGESSLRFVDAEGVVVHEGQLDRSAESLVGSLMVSVMDDADCVMFIDELMELDVPAAFTIGSERHGSRRRISIEVPGLANYEQTWRRRDDASPAR